MASRKRVEWAQLKVGIVAVVAMVITGALIILLTSQSNFFQGNFTLHTFMQDSAGMADNAAVRLNGISVGHIKKIALSGLKDPKKTVRIDMLIREEFLSLIPDDSTASINSSNLLGDKYINIAKGTHPKHVEANGEIPSLASQDIPEILAQASGLLGQFQTILTKVDNLLAVVDAGQGNLGKLIKDDSLYNRLNSTVAEVEQLVKDVKNSNGTISHLLYDDGLYNDIRRPIQRLDDMLAQVQQAKGTAGKLLYDPAVYDEARASLGEAKKMLDELNAGRGTAGKVLKDDELYRQLTGITGKLNAAIDRINAGQGSLGQFVVNPELYNSLTGATKELTGFLSDVHKDPKKFLRIKLALF
jgi:phospholipid/cholesterol/gamma-HCH transport system substrate-binding protein